MSVLKVAGGGDAYESLGVSSMLGFFLFLVRWRNRHRLGSRISLRSPIVVEIEMGWVWVRVI